MDQAVGVATCNIWHLQKGGLGLDHLALEHGGQEGQFGTVISNCHDVNIGVALGVVSAGAPVGPR